LSRVPFFAAGPSTRRASQLSCEKKRGGGLRGKKRKRGATIQAFGNVCGSSRKRGKGRKERGYRVFIGVASMLQRGEEMGGEKKNDFPW